MHKLLLTLMTLLTLGAAAAVGAAGINGLRLDPRYDASKSSCLFIGPLSNETALAMDRTLYLNGVRSEFIHTVTEQRILQQELLYRVELATYDPVTVLPALNSMDAEYEAYIIQPASTESPGLIGVGSYSVYESANELRLQLREQGFDASIQEVQVPIAGNDTLHDVEKTYLKLDDYNYLRFQHEIDIDLFARLHDRRDHVTLEDKMRFLIAENCELFNQI